MAYTVKPEAAKQQEALFNMLDQRNSHWCDQAGNLHTGTDRLKTGGQKEEAVDGDTRPRKLPGFQNRREWQQEITLSSRAAESGMRKSK